MKVYYIDSIKTDVREATVFGAYYPQYGDDFSNDRIFQLENARHEAFESPENSVFLHKEDAEREAAKRIAEAETRKAQHEIQKLNDAIREIEKIKAEKITSIDFASLQLSKELLEKMVKDAA